MQTEELKIFSDLLGAKLAESLAAKLPEAIAAGIALADTERAARAEAERAAQSEYTINMMKGSQAMAAHMANQDRAWEAKLKQDAIDEIARVARARSEMAARRKAADDAAALGLPLDPSSLPPVPVYQPEPEPAPRVEN